MIAHTLDSLCADDLHDVLHGEMIAVTTLTMGHLQQRLMKAPFRMAPILRSDDDFIRAFGPHAGPMLSASYDGKRFSDERIATLTATIARDWHSIRQSLTEIMVPPHDIERAFIEAGVPTQPAEIGISEKNYQQAVNHAFMVRDRFTFLDLAAMAETASDA
jgi:glycerol-1-phosphate dehydrogenase [NAD(P)+]